MQVPHQKRSEIHHHVTSPPAYQHVREAFQCGRLAADLLGSGPRLPQPSLDPARTSPPVEQSTRQSQDNRKTTTRQSTRQFKTLHKIEILLLAPWKKKHNIILYFPSFNADHQMSILRHVLNCLVDCLANVLRLSCDCLVIVL